MTLVPTLTAAGFAAVFAALATAPARAQPEARAACQGEPSATRLRVVIQGVRSADGVMTVTLYGDDPHKFLRGSGELAVWRAPAKTPMTQMCVWLPGPGTYGVAVYHDAKRAYRFTQGPFGMPTQDYGFSRNPHMFFGPPSFNAAKFPAGEGETTIYVRLRYP